jgi:hypothetical protein
LDLTLHIIKKHLAFKLRTPNITSKRFINVGITTLSFPIRTE